MPHYDSFVCTSRLVIALATLSGFDAVDCGDLRGARYLEPFAVTWIHMSIKLGYGRRFAFARLQR